MAEAPEERPDAGPAGEGRRRLDDEAVADRLAGLEETLGRLEGIPGATAETALAAVTMLAEVYGEALARVLDRAGDDRRLTDALLADDLVGHLLVLHDIHPEPAERRAARALEGLRAGLQHQGTEVELVGIEERTARVRLTGGGCGCGTTGQVEDAVREALLAAVPELAGVDLVAALPARSSGAFIPVGALLGRPVAAAEGAP